MAERIKVTTGILLIIFVALAGVLFVLPNNLQNSFLTQNPNMAVVSYYIKGTSLTSALIGALVLPESWTKAKLTIDKVIWIPANESEETNASVTHNLGVTVEISANGEAKILSENMNLKPGVYQKIKLVVRNVTVYNENGDVIDTWNTGVVHIDLKNPVVIQEGTTYTVIFNTDFNLRGHTIRATAEIKS